MHILCSVTFFLRSCSLWDNVEKLCRVGQVTDGNMAHAHCMLDTQGYKRTLRIRNTFCFSTATMVARRRLSVTLYIHCLFCYQKEQNTVNDPKHYAFIHLLQHVLAVYVGHYQVESQQHKWKIILRRGLHLRKVFETYYCDCTWWLPI